MLSTVLAVCLLLLGANRTAAQASWITINEPLEWSDNGTLTVPSGTRIRIVGQAYHPQGIQAITIASKTATLRRQTTGVIDFEVAFSVIPIMSSVRVVAQVVGGDTVTKELKLVVTTGGPVPHLQSRIAPAPAPAQSVGPAVPRSLFVHRGIVRRYGSSKEKAVAIK